MSTPDLTFGWPTLDRGHHTDRRVTHWWSRVVDTFAHRRGPVIDILAVLLSAFEVWISLPLDLAAATAEDPSIPHSVVVSILACLVLLGRRRFPFTVLLLTIPGFLIGWSIIAPMIALWTLARRRMFGWQTMVGFCLLVFCYVLIWPIDQFIGLTWQQHAHNVIWGLIVAGLPLALGMLAAARQELGTRLAQLRDGREREKQLHAIAVREQERTRLAREMHDGVSHQVTLITMQAGALSVSAPDTETENSARTIRELGLSALSELREMVGLLRSGNAPCSTTPEPVGNTDLNALDELLSNVDITVVVLRRDIPKQLAAGVSCAAYRTVQESLTNVSKHAPGAAATVDLHREGNRLLIEIRNGPPQRAATNLPSGGYGLAGLAERAEQLGGTFYHEVTDDGGFVVRACYPITGAGEDSGSGEPAQTGQDDPTSGDPTSGDAVRGTAQRPAPAGSQQPGSQLPASA